MAVILDFQLEYFSLFLSTSGPNTSYQVLTQLAFWVKEKNFKIDFQDSSHGIQLGFQIKKDLANFYLQVSLILLPS